VSVVVLLEVDSDGELLRVEWHGQLLEVDSDGELLEVDSDGELFRVKWHGQLFRVQSHGALLEVDSDGAVAANARGGADSKVTASTVLTTARSPAIAIRRPAWGFSTEFVLSAPSIKSSCLPPIE
jgi:hypothetical protein